MLKLITRENVREWAACYSEDILDQLYAEPKTPHEVLTFGEGIWRFCDVREPDQSEEHAGVPRSDRLWTVLRPEVLSEDKAWELFDILVSHTLNVTLADEAVSRDLKEALNTAVTCRQFESFKAIAACLPKTYNRRHVPSIFGMRNYSTVYRCAFNMLTHSNMDIPALCEDDDLYDRVVALFAPARHVSYVRIVAEDVALMKMQLAEAKSDGNISDYAVLVTNESLVETETRDDSQMAYAIRNVLIEGINDEEEDEEFVLDSDDVEETDEDDAH